MRRPSTTKPPEKCNILGMPYRSVSIILSIIMLLQNLSFVVSFILKDRICCAIFSNGFYSLIIQFGDDNWSLAGLMIAIICLATNAALLVGAIWRIKHLILSWYIGGIIQFVYLLSLQTLCLSANSCSNGCEMDRVASSYYTWGFGWSLFITLCKFYLLLGFDCYLTFIFKIQLFYSYLAYKEQLRILRSKEEICMQTFSYNRSQIRNK